MQNSSNFFAIILAGGSGQRLWPLSRGSTPKQLIPMPDGKSLLEAAFERVESVVPSAQRWVCAGNRYEEAVRERLPGLSCFIGEPCGRDTLAAVALSCAHAHAVNPDAIVALLTSDHIIQPGGVFRKALSEAFALVSAKSDVLVTFGVKPTSAATGYGYLELGGKFSETALWVKNFKEKPDSLTAEKYLAQGPSAYLWNSGMFVWRAERFLEVLAKYELDIARCIETVHAAIGTDAYDQILAKTYPLIAKKSVDYGVMEPASHDPDVRIMCIPLDLDWMDIGSWNIYGLLGDSDEYGNTAMLASREYDAPPVVFLDSKNTLAVSTDAQHLLACFGCENMVIVHTQDATLVCPRSRVEELKLLYAKAAEKGWG